MKRTPMKIVCTDRYQAAGVPYPDPETVCLGQCEGIGYYPRRQSAIVRLFRFIEWRLRPDRFHLELRPDGYDFVVCKDCGGTGRRR